MTFSVSYITLIHECPDPTLFSYTYDCPWQSGALSLCNSQHRYSLWLTVDTHFGLHFSVEMATNDKTPLCETLH